MTSFMKKILASGSVATLILGVATVSVVPAQAGDNGGAIAAGVVGGLALGAIAGSAAANANNGYGGGYPAYGAPQRAYGGGCYYERRPVYDDYGEMIGRRRVRVCE